MIEYTVKLTAVQHRAMQHIAADPVEWLQKTIETRANAAIDEIVKEEMELALKENRLLQFANKDDLVLNSKLKTGAERNVEFEQQLQEYLAKKANQEFSQTAPQS